MTEQLTYRLSFDIPVDSISLLWPRFPEPQADYQYVVTYAAWDTTGEPIPTSSFGAPLSNLLGFPFRYVTAHTHGHAASKVELKDRPVSRLEIVLRPWGRSTPRELPAAVGPLVAQGARRSSPPRSVAIIQEGDPT